MPKASKTMLHTRFYSFFIALFQIFRCLKTLLKGKEGLYHITRRAAERLNSSVLLANAWHHRSDALSSALVLLGVLCRVFVHSAFDPIAGAVLSSIILRVAYGIGHRAVSELLDMQLPKQVCEREEPFKNAGLRRFVPRGAGVFVGFSWRFSIFS